MRWELGAHIAALLAETVNTGWGREASQLIDLHHVDTLSFLFTVAGVL